MTVEEADHYLDWLDEYIAQMEKTAQQAKHRRRR